MESGLYQTASEVVREALRLLKERDLARDQLRADVQSGFSQLMRDQGAIYGVGSATPLSQKVKAEGRKARARKR